MAMIRPLGDRVLVELAETAEVMRGGILIPETSKEKPVEGVVVAVGKKAGGVDEASFDVKIGDKVVLPKYGGTEVKLGGKTLQLLREDELLGVIL